MTTARAFWLSFTIGLALCALIAWLFIRRDGASPIPPPPPPAPTARPTPTPEPFEPPPTEPEDDEPPIATIPVCHCVPAYGACVDLQMVREAARLHAVAHDHDLIGRGCATAGEEDHALWRVLRRPEAIETNGRSPLVMADRAAWRERVEAGP